MTNSLYKAELYKSEFHLSLDRECQKLVDSWYALFDKLKYYEEDCKFELPIHIQKLKQTIFNLLSTYKD